MDVFNSHWVRCDNCAKMRRVPFSFMFTEFEMCDWTCDKNTWDFFNKCEIYQESISDEGSSNDDMSGLEDDLSTCSEDGSNDTSSDDSK